MKKEKIATFHEKFTHELRRGTLVLAALSQLKEARYGYALIDQLAKQGLDIEQGTLYPLLRRLEEQGLLQSEWNVEGSHPHRYYVIIAILLFLPDKIGVVLSPGMEFILNPVIIGYIPLIILTLLLGIGLDVILLWRGRWETSTRIAKIATNLFDIYVLYLLITGHNSWLTQQGVAGFLPILEALPEGSTPSMEMMQIISMQAFRMAFVIALIVTVVDTINMAYQLVKRIIENAASSPIMPSKNT